MTAKSLNVDIFGTEFEFEFEPELGCQIKPPHAVFHLLGKTKHANELYVCFRLHHHERSLADSAMSVGISVVTQLLSCEPEALQENFQAQCRLVGEAILRFVLERYTEHVREPQSWLHEAGRRSDMQMRYWPAWKKGVLTASTQATNKVSREPIVHSRPSVPTQVEMLAVLQKRAEESLRAGPAAGCEQGRLADA